MNFKKIETISYYDKNAQEFYDRTIRSDVFESYRRFLRYLFEGAHILDAGCGVGRDAKYFLSKGYKINPFDASEKMVEMANKETGIDVVHTRFQDMNFEEVFDGVWAQASLLHIPYDETRDVYRKIYSSLKPGGIFYASYKHGSGLMVAGERNFYTISEDKVRPYLEGLFEILEIWLEKDKRSRVAPSKDRKLLNFIVKKSC